MLFWVTIKVALKSLVANKLRSVLAMLGIIIGVGAVISMLALGKGAQESVMKQWSVMGTNLLVVRPGQRGTGGVMSGTQQNLTVEDADALVKVAGVHAVAPVVGGFAQLKHLERNSRCSLTGTSITWFPMRAFQIERGAAFSELDVERVARVAVLGPVTAEQLFGVEDPIGGTIKLNGINFRVTGVLKSKGDQGWYNPDDQVVIPYTTAMKQVLGVDYVREIDIDATPGSDITRLQDEITTILRKRHRTQPGAPDDFFIRNQAEMIAAATSSSQTFTILLGGVAGISLLVGGIGIMNIMLVTVTERTREIGVRKAIGAKDRDILRQFLIESVVMSGLGGLLGIAGGIGGADLIRRLSEFEPIVQLQSILLSFGFAAGVGVFFGFYPAFRASRLDPIVALRYE
jgi:putative ABC transport system permease protein